MPRCPHTTQFAWFGDVEAPKPRYLRGFWPLGCREPRNFGGFLGVRMPKTTLFARLGEVEAPQTTVCASLLAPGMPKTT